MPPSTEALFDSDTHRMIDISYTVTPGENPDRPFAIQRGLLADGTYKYNVLDTHSHVGTHVEGSGHYYGHEEGTPIVDYPLERFYGPGVLFSVTDPVISADSCERALAGTIHEGDIVVARNDTGTELAKAEAYNEDVEAPAFTPEAAEWLANHNIKALVLGDLRLGETIDKSNTVHEVLMDQGAVFVEIVDNLEAITRDRFTVLALPYKVERLGSSFCRAVVIEKR